MFEISSREEGEWTVIAAKGEIDVGVTSELWDAIEEVLDRGRPLKVRLDEVRYIDSSGIATLIRGLKHAKKGGIDYVLSRPSKRVCDVLELARLERLFTIEPADPVQEGG